MSCRPWLTLANVEIISLAPDEIETINNLHKEDGKFHSLCDYAGGMGIKGEIMGWSYEELGWDAKAFAVKDGMKT